MKRYLPQLDGLRALAILLVIADHIALLRSGYLGVEVFFVLSGYLITTILLNEREAGRGSLKRFYTRRARRLYPALLLMLALTLPVDPLIVPGGAAHRWLAVGAAATYTSVFPITTVGIGWMGGLAHTWSLSIEEQFYLLWPLAIPWISRCGLYLLTALLLAALILSGSPFAASGIILLGCVLAVAGRGHESSHPNLLAASSAALLILTLALGLFPPLQGSGVLGVLVGVATVGLIQGSLQGGWAATALAARPLVWLGRRSYGVYLWHQPLLALLVWPDPSPFRIALAVGLSVLLAAASYRYVEMPIRRAGQTWDGHDANAEEIQVRSVGVPGPGVYMP